MLIDNTLNMRVQIQRHAMSSYLYTVHLCHPDHGQLQRTFSVYDELEQTLSALQISPGDLQRARTSFMNGKMNVALGGEHTITAADLVEHNFRKKGQATSMNADPHIWFLQTTSGAESHIQCEGRLWIKEHLSLPAALDFAVLQNWLVDVDYVGIPTERLQFGWSKAIKTTPTQLEVLGFQSRGTL
jgi:hypothetical protein